MKPIEGPNYEGVGGTVVVTRDGAPVAVLIPQKRQFWVQHQVTTRDRHRVHRGNNLLLALGDDLGAGRWSVRLQIRPLVSFIWLGALIMAIGGGVAPPTGATARRAARAAAPSAPRPSTAPMNRFLRAAGGLRAARGGAGDRHPPLARTRAIIVSPLFGKPAPQFALPDARRTRRTRCDSAALQGALVPAQRLGHLVRGVPRRARDAAADASSRARCRSSASTGRTRTRRRRPGSRSSATPTSVVAVDRDGRAAIDWGVYGAPETFLVNPAGHRRLQARRRADEETWKQEFLPRLPGAGGRADARAGAAARWRAAAGRGARCRGRSTPRQLADPALQARYLALTHELRCMQCQNESHRRLAGGPGRGPAPPGARAAARRQDRRRDPRLHGGALRRLHPVPAALRARNAWLWVAPAVLLLLGALVAWRVVRAAHAAAGRRPRAARRGHALLMVSFVLLAAALTLARRARRGAAAAAARPAAHPPAPLGRARGAAALLVVGSALLYVTWSNWSWRAAAGGGLAADHGRAPGAPARAATRRTSTAG